MDSQFPTQTRVVIVGGGIIGCSIAYHLAKLGWKDVVLLEQNQLAGGTTWHAAGLVGRLRTTNSMTKINKYSAELYAGLERETGHSVGWKQVGSLIVARSHDRMTQLRRSAAMSEWFGVEVQLISPESAKEKWPLVRIDDVLGSSWLAACGRANWGCVAASPFPSTRSSTITWSPRRSTARSTSCRSAATPIFAFIFAAKPTRSCSARFRPCPSPGWSSACRTISR